VGEDWTGEQRQTGGGFCCCKVVSRCRRLGLHNHPKHQAPIHPNQALTKPAFRLPLLRASFIIPA
jgi:hypothetical protein